MEKAYSKGDISIIKNLFDDSSLKMFERINEKLDLLLGFYYRSVNGKNKARDVLKVQKAKEELDSYLDILNSHKHRL